MLLSAPPHTPRTADGTCSASTTATANAPGSTQKRSDSIVSPRTPARTLSATRSARPSRGITTIAQATSDQVRYYDGFIENADGTYTGIEIKGGTGSRDAAQRGFDATVSPERPATATLNGERITITRVILETVK